MLLLIILKLMFIILVFLVFWFNRDPRRKIPAGNNIVSPADGKIIEIIPVHHKRSIKVHKGLIGKIRTLISDTVKEGYLISIFMSPMDVHINRAPVKGKIIKVKHTAGNFLKADSLHALHNEKNEILIENKDIGRVKVIQIAGLIARRIICNVRKNYLVSKGQKIGKITLSSQVVLIVPKKGISLKVWRKQRVVAGKTIIAEIIKK